MILARTIQGRFTRGFVLIFTLSAILMYLYTGHLLDTRTERLVESDMQQLQKLSREIAKQSALLAGPAGNGTDPSLAERLVRQLSAHSRMAAFYDPHGQLTAEAHVSKNGFILMSQRESELLQRTEQDVQAALSNRSLYTIAHLQGPLVQAVLTYPLYIDGKLLGVIRMVQDYTATYADNDSLLRRMALFTLLLFVLVFAFSYVLTRSITKPMAILTRALRQVGEGNFLTPAMPLHAQDEVGELARSFQAMRDKIEHLEQSRQQFYHHVTHELKTPLTTISGYAQIIGEPGFADAEFLHKAAGKITDESNRLHRMVIELIQLSRREGWTAKGTDRSPMSIDWSELVRSCCEDMAMPAAQMDVKLRLQLSPAVVMAEHGELRQVVLNLLDNAIKYAIRGTKIHVTLQAEQSTARLCIANSTSLPLGDHSEQLFEPFYRVGDRQARDRESMGLGLAISRSIIHQHQGVIRLEHNNGQVIVSVLLPLGHNPATTGYDSATSAR
ncbi:sensor histidine kinase [Paenibacillus sp. SYP-B4298]|uniref:sensor histidine kinase n=1 Tax=Paenibacillus sp. SYP-B4298 TaxID=2996034 RepID=UPI0022DD4073|nr:ATP-binding protein [Paenibacillus sp. SYP-B4298]